METDKKLSVVLCGSLTMIRLGYEVMISEREINVIAEAPTERELIRQYDVSIAPPDACVIFYLVPRFLDLKYIAEIKQKWPRVKIVAMLSFKISFFNADLYKRGVDYCSYSDLKSEELWSMFRSLANQQRYFATKNDAQIFQQVMERDYEPPKLTDTELFILNNINMRLQDMAIKLQIPAPYLKYQWKKLAGKIGVIVNNIDSRHYFLPFIEETLFPGAVATQEYVIPHSSSGSD